MHPENCDRCGSEFDNETIVIMCSQDHPVIGDVGNLTYYLCEDCSSSVLHLISEPETRPVVVSVP